MNDLYASYPSNIAKSVRHIALPTSKDPLKTFIGGLFIGTVLGALIVSVLISHVLL